MSFSFRAHPFSLQEASVRDGSHSWVALTGMTSRREENLLREVESFDDGVCALLPRFSSGSSSPLCRRPLAPPSALQGDAPLPEHFGVVLRALFLSLPVPAVDRPKTSNRTCTKPPYQVFSKKAPSLPIKQIHRSIFRVESGFQAGITSWRQIESSNINRCPLPSSEYVLKKYLASIFQAGSTHHKFFSTTIPSQTGPNSRRRSLQFT
ncbi:hypothetical protein B0H16DRAFT_900249 [Mycena metata]|uniref:Uncharacterized protein n=1 Tax=Mycena metata TaxID=1033252 RepID=A0AAD7DKZ8_9AGAR|nr:hypothetical protein B0H16DRAFT_900249 [Mycena metata]